MKNYLDFFFCKWISSSKTSACGITGRVVDGERNKLLMLDSLKSLYGMNVY